MSQRIYDCPQCGAQVRFQSSIAVFAICEHCRSMVVVRDAKVETMGVMAELPPDLSPFQIGTTGEWNGKGFEIIGRVRVEWEQGSWNEWCLLYDATVIGWLAEAQGLLMISFQSDPGYELSNDSASYEAGNTLDLAGTRWSIDDVKQVCCRSSEGELPVILPPHGLRVGVDLSNTDSGFASIEFSENGVDFYVGEYVQFDDLKLNNLHPVPGWDGEIAKQSNRTTALACPNCGAAVELRAAGQTMSAVCGNCGTLIDTATPQLEIIEKASSAQQSFTPLLPIGQRGKLFDLEYEVIGLMERRDLDCRWSEYLLFNPWQGFQWLVFYKGHWTFVTRLPGRPDFNGSCFRENDLTYRLYAKSRAKVKGVIGEFYWKTRRDETAEITDFIAPPYIISKETYPDLNEISWSRGCYVDRAVIEQGFSVKNLPIPSEIYLNQPNPYDDRWESVKTPFFIALITLFIIQLGFIFNRPETEKTHSSFTYDQALQQTPPPTPILGVSTSLTEKTATTPHFQINGPQSRVVIAAAASVDNNWLDLDMELVNVQTNEAFPAELELSYYHGYDDGEWSEGSRFGSISIAAVPPGEYQLSIETNADRSIRLLPYKVSVRSGGVFISNFLASLLAVLIYPIYLLWRKNSFERTRWSDSNFTPYTHIPL